MDPPSQAARTIACHHMCDSNQIFGIVGASTYKSSGCQEFWSLAGSIAHSDELQHHGHGQGTGKCQGGARPWTGLRPAQVVARKACISEIESPRGKLEDCLQSKQRLQRRAAKSRVCEKVCVNGMRHAVRLAEFGWPHAFGPRAPRCDVSRVMKCTLDV